MCGFSSSSTSSAEYCGRLLAGLGADVVKAEPPEGSPSRSFGPFAGDEPDPDRSLCFWADNVGKTVGRGQTRRRGPRPVRRRRRDGAHSARTRSRRRVDLDFASLSARFPDLVVCAVTPFGQSGPWADYLADDLVLMALGGSMAACGYRPGADGNVRHSPARFHGRPGLEDGFDLRRDSGARGLLLRSRATGSGQFIDVSAHECSASMTEWHLLTYICSGAVYRGRPIPP